MSEIIYSINGKYLKSGFGIHIRDSSGFGALRRKSLVDFSFPEQHGDSFDLSQVYYESREINFDCWIVADGIQKLYDNFNAFKAELMKPNTQRLLIQFPPIAKDREYRVVLMDGIELDVKHKKGKVFANFQLKLKEFNPIKKVFQYYGYGNVNLRYDSPDETEIFTSEGGYINALGNVNTTLNLTGVNKVDQTNFKGRNLLSASWSLVVDAGGVGAYAPVSGYIHGLNMRYYFRLENAFFHGQGSRFRVEFKPFANTLPSIFLDFDAYELSTPEDRVRSVDLKQTTYQILVHNIDPIAGANPSPLEIENVSLTRDYIDYYKPAPEELKTVVIAGDISKIKNVYFEGSELWKEL